MITITWPNEELMKSQISEALDNKWCGDHIRNDTKCKQCIANKEQNCRKSSTMSLDVEFECMDTILSLHISLISPIIIYFRQSLFCAEWVVIKDRIYFKYHKWIMDLKYSIKYSMKYSNVKPIQSKTFFLWQLIKQHEIWSAYFTMFAW